MSRLRDTHLLVAAVAPYQVAGPLKEPVLFADGVIASVENLGPVVNSDADEYELCIPGQRPSRSRNGLGDIYQMDLGALHELARQTGGKLLSGPQDAFQATSTSKATMPYALWPWLLLIAGLLLPIEIAARRGILGSLFSRRSWRRLHFGRSSG